jgi:hypothetical protein
MSDCTVVVVAVLVACMRFISFCPSQDAMQGAVRMVVSTYLIRCRHRPYPALRHRPMGHGPARRRISPNVVILVQFYMQQS